MIIATQQPIGRPSSDDEGPEGVGLDVVDVVLVVDEEELEREVNELAYVDTPRSSHISLRDCRFGL